jgi:hypothetical protein
MRTPTTTSAIAAALIAAAGCTPTTTTVRPVEDAGSPATGLHVDVLTGTRAAPATLRDADTARAVVTAEAAPPSPEPTPHRTPPGGHPPQAPSPVPDELDGSDQLQDGQAAARRWAPDGPEAAVAAELKRRFEAQGLTVLDLDIRPASRDENAGRDDDRRGDVTRLEVVVVHTSGHSHPHQSVYLAALTDDDGWQVLELQVQP